MVVMVFWLYVVVLVTSCFVHWRQIYKRVQLNEIRQNTKRGSRKRIPMGRSMFSITALERSANSMLEMQIPRGSYVPYKELKRLRAVTRSRSDSAVLEHRRDNLEYKTFHV